MNLFERLKRQFIQEREAEYQRAQQKFDRQVAERQAQQQKELDGKAQHELRREKAEAIRQESGIDVLMRRFYEVVEGESYPMVYPSTGRLPALDRPKDLAGAYDGVEWGLKYVGQVAGQSQMNAEGRSWYVPVWVDIHERKFIVTESRPDGNIVFHAAKDLLVLEPTWRKNRSILEDVLEQSFNNPGLRRFHIPPTRYD